MNKRSRLIKAALANPKAAAKTILIILGGLGVLAMAARPFVADHKGVLVAAAVWLLLCAVSIIAWAICWYVYRRRNPENPSGWWSERGLVLVVFVLTVIGSAGAYAIIRFG